METLLIVDDTKINLDILVELLGDKYDVLVALNGKDALATVADEKIDLILLDIMMPEMDGYEICRILKSSDKTNNIPIIFITAKTDEDSIERAYDVGGSDYVTKPFKPKELLARINNQLQIKSLIKRLEHTASHDMMTGILNRRSFFQNSERLFSKHHSDLCAIMVDIDKFKRINDAYGHAVGDEVLKMVTNTICEQLEEDAIFGRLGGEEFAIVLRSSDPVAIIKKMELIRKSIEVAEIETSNKRIVKFTVSMGIAKVTDQIKNIDELLEEADQALYEAKGTGRNKTILRKRK